MVNLCQTLQALAILSATVFSWQEHSFYVFTCFIPKTNLQSARYYGFQVAPKLCPTSFQTVWCRACVAQSERVQRNVIQGARETICLSLTMGLSHTNLKVLTNTLILIKPWCI